MEPLAEAIRVHPLISGLQISSVTHKIGLHADNINVAMTNPTQSLPVLYELLMTFEEISLYKINCSKSSMLSICLDQITKPALVSFHMGSSFFYYLFRHTVNCTPQNMLCINFENLLKKWHNLWSKLRNLLASRAGKIALTKMFLMPRFIFILNTACHIPNNPISHSSMDSQHVNLGSQTP